MLKICGNYSATMNQHCSHGRQHCTRKGTVPPKRSEFGQSLTGTSLLLPEVLAPFGGQPGLAPDRVKQRDWVLQRSAWLQVQKGARLAVETPGMENSCSTLTTDLGAIPSLSTSLLVDTQIPSTAPDCNPPLRGSCSSWLPVMAVRPAWESATSL